MTQPSGEAWNLQWLTPGRCRLILAALLLFTFCRQLLFLTHHCPLDLAGDEAQYWDWSRHLDFSYYSKGPLTSWLIAASCAAFGNSMPAVRFPALILAIGSLLCTYWMTRKLFGSDRLALGACLLGQIVPLFIAGTSLMTIDSPFFFCWALASCWAAKAVLDDSRWAWPAAGAAAGLGFLAKYAMLLWLPGILLFLLLDRRRRPALRTAGPWIMVLTALAFTGPVILWNAQHDWVSLRHVAAQTGAERATSHGNALAFIGSQLAVVNPPLAVILIGAMTYALGRRGRSDPGHRSMSLLLCLGLPLLGLCLLDSLATKVQANWPGPAYFSLMILTAYFLATRLHDKDRWWYWRSWFYAAVIVGLAFQPILYGSTALYPAAAWVNRTFPTAGRPRLAPARFDLAARLRGIADPLAVTVGRELRQLPPGSLLFCEDYQTASQLAFYVDGQPDTYVLGSYWTDPIARLRMTQFDVWPDRQLDRPDLLGKDAIYVGGMETPLTESFALVQALPDIVIACDGQTIRTVQVWRCTGFKGMHRPGGIRY